MHRNNEGGLSPSEERTKGGKIHCRAAVELKFVVDELVGSLSLDGIFGHLVLWDIVGGIARAIGEGVDVAALCEMVARRDHFCLADHLLCVDVFVQHGVCVFVCVCGKRRVKEYEVKSSARLFAKDFI